jgi:hypothetical protein
MKERKDNISEDKVFKNEYFTEKKPIIKDFPNEQIPLIA